MIRIALTYSGFLPVKGRTLSVLPQPPRKIWNSCFDLACHSLLPSICKCCVVSSITSRALSVHCTLSFWKFSLARLRAHFFCLNERGAELAGRQGRRNPDNVLAAILLISTSGEGKKVRREAQTRKESTCPNLRAPVCAGKERTPRF